jgi:hypothetical protein
MIAHERIGLARDHQRLLAPAAKKLAKMASEEASPANQENHDGLSLRRGHPQGTPPCRARRKPTPLACRAEATISPLAYHNAGAIPIRVVLRARPGANSPMALSGSSKGAAYGSDELLSRLSKCRNSDI